MTIQHFTHILTQTCRAGDGVDRTRPSARRMSAMSQLHERATQALCAPSSSRHTVIRHTAATWGDSPKLVSSE